MYNDWPCWSCFPCVKMCKTRKNKSLFVHIFFEGFLCHFCGYFLKKKHAKMGIQANGWPYFPCVFWCAESNCTRASHYTLLKLFYHIIFENGYTFLRFVRVCRNVFPWCRACGWNSVFRLAEFKWLYTIVGCWEICRIIMSWFTEIWMFPDCRFFFKIFSIGTSPGYISVINVGMYEGII